MTIDLNLRHEDNIKSLQDKNLNIPKWATLSKDYDPKEHKVITDTTLLKDKVRSDGTIDKSTRVALALEKIATTRMAEFVFAIPVGRSYSGIEGDERLGRITQALESIYKKARIDSENYKRGTAYFASCEVCTVWYAEEKPNTLYGFKSKYKLKCKTYSPMQGYELYPLFDAGGDMLAMSIGYKAKELGKEVEYFESWTESQHIVWRKQEGQWALHREEAVTIGKIPAVYMHRSAPIYADITGLREELELTLSRNGNIVAYNAAPILKVSGDLVGSESRGEGRRVYQTTEKGDVGYVSWDQSIEATKYQVDNLLRFIFMQLQLPDLSFDAMRGLGNIGYDARQTLLTDAHLKVGDEQYPIIEFLEREANIIKEYYKLMDTTVAGLIDSLDIEHSITPFIQNDEKAEIERRLLANGGKPIESQLESIQRFGQSHNASDTLEQIRSEEQALSELERKVDVFTSAQ